MVASSSQPPVLRFAPSPNGLLHLGHAYSALLTFGAAARMGGEALLRIEDIDLERCKPGFVSAILEDLGWLGLSWPEPVLRQSSRFAAYGEAADQLRARDLLYPCFCTRREIAAEAQGHDPDGAPLYGGRCARRDPGEVERLIAEGVPHQWRLAMGRALAAAGPLAVAESAFLPDLALGAPAWRPLDPARWGDVVLVRKDVPTSYHLAVVVDDAFEGITHVTRGADLLAATDIHVLLQALLGLPHPVYAHHGLVLDETDAKLAKSRGSESLASLRASGWTPEDVRRRLGLDPGSGAPR